MLSLITRARTSWSVLRERVFEERGATAVEYAIMLAFIAAVIFVAVAFLGTQTNSQFQKVTFQP